MAARLVIWPPILNSLNALDFIMQHTNESRWPRALSRDEAANYIGLGVTFFDKLRAENKMPAPVKIGKRVLFDIRKLDAAFDSLQLDGQDGRPNDFD